MEKVGHRVGFAGQRIVIKNSSSESGVSLLVKLRSARKKQQVRESVLSKLRKPGAQKGFNVRLESTD